MLHCPTCGNEVETVFCKLHKVDHHVLPHKVGPCIEAGVSCENCSDETKTPIELPSVVEEGISFLESLGGKKKEKGSFVKCEDCGDIHECK